MSIKTCSKCKQEKQIGEFYKRSDRGTYYAWCKQCKTQSNRKWHQENKERHRELTQRWYNENKEYHLQNSKKWYESNKHRKLESYYARVERIKRATPNWAERKELQEIYRKCSEINKQTGIQHQVDHIIPLCNNHVCGLNVPDNLQIITAEENLRKSNRFSIT